MNFGISDVNLEKLSISSKLSKREQKVSEDASKEIELSSIVDLADLLKEKSLIFKWMEEVEPSQSPSESKHMNL